MKVEITGYKFIEKEFADSSRGELSNEIGLPRKKGDVTIYWQNYEEASLDEPIFFYMVGDRSMNKILGKPLNFIVTFPDEPKQGFPEYEEEAKKPKKK